MNTFDGWSSSLVKYFTFLTRDLGRGKPEGDGSYVLLYEELFKHIYTPSVGNDVDRSRDGLEIREKFLLNSGLDRIKDIPLECTFLEMLVGLAIRMNFALYDPEDPNRIGVYFWVMINNVEIGYSDDAIIDNPVFTTGQIIRAVEGVNERLYAPSGIDGGLFPLPWTEKNMREMELWYQMQEYLSEKY